MIWVEAREGLEMGVAYTFFSMGHEPNGPLKHLYVGPWGSF